MTSQFLASNTLAFVLCALVLGLLVGSFLNVVIHRLPIMMQRVSFLSCLPSLLRHSISSFPIHIARTAIMRFAHGKIFRW